MTELPYLPERVSVDVRQLAGWTGRDLRDDLRVSGPCPACHHTTRATVPLRTTTLESTEDRPLAVTASVVCACPVTHPGRPDGVPDGCGRSWSLSAATRDGAVVVAPAGDPDLVEAAEELRRATAQEHTGVRTAAQHWIAGVAAISGLLGVLGVGIARDPIMTLPVPARLAVALLGAVAVGLAAASIGYAHAAAHGFPLVRVVRDDHDLRSWYAARRAAPARAAGRLRLGVRTGLGALTALTLAVGLVLFVPPARREAGPVRLTLVDDAQICGALLASTADGVVRVRRADSGDLAEVPLVEVVTFAPVRSC